MNQSDFPWHEGPPPHIGWWNASVHIGGDKCDPFIGAPDCWRWWDGHTWGQPYQPGQTVYRYEHTAWNERVAEIRWNTSYPENALVPRVNPLLRRNRLIVEAIQKAHRCKLEGNEDGAVWWRLQAKVLHAASKAREPGEGTVTTRAMRGRMKKPKPVLVTLDEIAQARDRQREMMT